MKKLIPVLLLSLVLPIFTAFAQTPAYKDTPYVYGFAPATSMEFAPDGRIFVAERGGKVRVVKNGQLLPTPFLTVPVSLNSERGLGGITLDPNFKTNGYVYIYYTRTNEPIKNRLSRFTASAANPDVADPSSEKILLDDIPSDAGNHNGGALHFGKDGKLYVAVGDGGSFHANSQILSNLSGKILRLNSDGTIPSDNPFIGYALPGVRTEIWAFGLRNPFTFAVDPASGKILINDVGETTWEEINLLERGENYGWPKCEGPLNTGTGTCVETDYKYPVYAYNHNKKGASITGAAFYKGDYYFGDIVLKFIRKMNSNNVVTDFIQTSELPVDIDAGPDGNLYYLAYGGKIMKIIPQDAPVNGVCAITVVNYCQVGTLNDTPDSATQALWSCVGSSGGTTASCSAPLVTNKLPTATITTPASGAKYTAGQTISFSGTGTDPEDGTLPASAFSWTVVFHHNTHTHPFLGPITGKTSDSFVIPNTGELADDVWYRIHLTVTDSKGAKSETVRDIYPNVVNLTFRTDPPGKNVVVDGQPQTTPYIVKSVVGMKRVISVEAKDFFEWSNGGTREQTITTPNTDTVYTASFSAPRPTSVVMQPYYGSGDLATLMQKEVDDRIGNNSANATTKSLWYTRGTNTNAWEQNPNVFTSSGQRGINLDGQSPWNSLDKYARSGTLISPRHIIFAKHFRLSPGTTVVFIDPNNKIIERTIEKVELAPDPIDIGIGLLNKDVPENIPFYPVVPRAAWQQYLGNIRANVDIPVIYLDMEDKVGVHVIKANALFSNSVNISHAKGTGKRAEFDEPIVLGDSGNPAFVIIGGQPVLVFNHYDFPFGPNLSSHFDLINSLMTKLGGGYQLSTLDLSRFSNSVPKYTLTVTKTGNGTVIAVGGINCGTNCSAQYNKDTTVSLAADKANGYTFIGWSGDCSGTGLCVVTMDKAKNVTANFSAVNTAPVAQNATFTFSGASTNILLTATDAENDTLTFSPSTFPNNSKGTLTKGATEGSYVYTVKTPLPTTPFSETFTFIASDGKLVSNLANITMQYTVVAPPKYTLTVSKTGLGTVQGTGISCGADCTEPVNAGSVVSLLAIPASGYTFSKWTGDCTNTSISCSVTMDKARTVSAVFVQFQNLDGDGDGVPLPQDRCPNTLPAVRNQVNRVGCVRPKISKFNTKPAIEDDITAVQNVELGINNIGKIKFNSPVSLTRENAVIDVDTNVIIEQDKVEIKSSVVPELNKPATITLYNVDEKNPRILRDGVVCQKPQCEIVSFVNGALTFNVNGFSIYTVEETPTTPTTTPTEPVKKKRRGGGGGGGGGTTSQTKSTEQLIAELTAQLNMLIAQLNALTGNKVTSNLSIGMRSEEVKTLQQNLNRKGIFVPSTGYFGTMTQTAVKKFQLQNNLPQTGIVDALTRAALNR